ncbi:MAG: hypothetical protein M0P97_03945 [Candidatus Moranbacteria bacterium]|jgi:hypothetical protein|nr:hypothetical protein [Candidatus Moranbacteria bacterium]
MKEQILSQLANKIKNFKIIWVIAISIIATVLISGGIYIWQNSKIKIFEYNSRQRIISLQSQLTQSQNEYVNLTGQKLKCTESLIDNISYNLINDYCNINECLFNLNNSDYPLGISTATGYYSSIEKSDLEGTKKCDNFTITEGSKELVRAMVNLVNGGNTLHSLNNLGQPVVNLGLELINESEKQNIINSSVKNQIKLIVLNVTPKYAGVTACHPEIIVLRKK